MISIFRARLTKSTSIAIVLVGSVLLAAQSASAQVNILTSKMDNARTGQNINETTLTTSNVNSNQFGKVFAFNVDGYVSAQPLYMSSLAINGGTHNVVFVATEHNSLYAIDADTGTQLWQVNFGPSVPSTAEGCPVVTGLNEVGILSTPVIDASTNTLYLTSKTYVSSVASYSLHALDVTTGLEKLGGPVTISGMAGGLTFPALQHKQRPGLLLSNGQIYLGFGSNGCDLNARGWMFVYDATSLQQLTVMTTQPDNSYGSSLWQGGVGPAGDSDGNVYVSTANGLFNYSLLDLGDSVLKLSLSNGSLNVLDYFTPFDQDVKAANDIDLGSGAITILPYQQGASRPNLLITSSKDAALYLLDMDNLGGYNMVDNSQIPDYVPNALGNEFFGSPVYWNNTVYLSAHLDYLRAFALNTDTSGNSTVSQIAQTSLKLTVNGLPVISANGNTNGIVWLVRAIKGVPLLSAYDATTLSLLYDSGMNSTRDSLGTFNTHFGTPIVANGKVYAGTQTQLVVYGLLPQLTANGGGGQIGMAGTTLPVPISVIATDAKSGNPLPGITVTFSDGGKKGTFSNPTATTDNNGQASTTYTLPTLAQTLTVTASATGFGNTTFIEQGVAGPVAALSVVSGGKQVGTVGTTLPLPLVFKAKDSLGNVVSGASIAFSDGAGGTLSPNPAITGSNGQASTTYTLPTVAKALTVSASVGSIIVRASEESTPGPATTMNIVQGNNQTAHPNNKLPKTLIVSVTDQYGNGISGLTVNFTDNGAGGIFSSINPVTSTTGRVTVTYTTPAQKGTVTITASYSTLAPAVFTETVN